MDIDIYDLFSPRCLLCFSDNNTPEDFLLQINCRHILCCFCLRTIKGENGGYICPIDKAEYFGVWEMTNTVEMIRKMREARSRHTAVLNIQTIRGIVNYEGVLCRWPQCVRTLNQWDCPYLHSFNPIQNLQCPLGTQCWRLEVCPLKHAAELTRGRVEVRAKSVWDGLVNKDGMREILAKRGAAGCKFEANFRTDPELTRARWLFLTSADTSTEEFNAATSEHLEEKWKHREATCELANNAVAYFSHMVAVFPSGDFHLIARLETLETYKTVAVIDFECPPESLPAVVSDIEEMEVEMEAPIRLGGKDMEAMARYYGISIESGKMVGSQTSIQLVFEAILSEPVQIFPHIARYRIPDQVFLPAVIEDIRLTSLLIVNRQAYGSPMDIERLQNICVEYEFAVNCPAGVDEYNLMIVCSQVGVVFSNGKLVGRTAAVTQALELLDNAIVMIPPEFSEEDLAIVMSLFPVEIVGNTIKGSKECIEQALAHIKNLEIEADFPTNLTFEVVQNALTTYKVRLQGTKIVGGKDNVAKALAFFENQKRPADLKMGFEFHVLPEWYLNLDMDVYCEDMEATSPEFEEASTYFYETMKGQATIQNVYMIFNKKLYTNFAYKHESKSKVEGRSLNIMLLFHGTRQTNPQIIYESEEGLDSRLGGGMWGNGSYYAKNASYSHGFAFHTSNGNMQMFLCEVLVGDYVTLPPQALVKPPQKKKSTSCYHSVKGHTAGSDIWITYEVSMSYPKYLIEYRAGG